MVTTRLMTVEDLARMGPAAERHELIDGVLQEVEPVGGQHGVMGGDLAGYIWTHVRERRLGEVFTSDTQFVIDHDRDSVLRPDVAFIRNDRLPRDDVWEGIVPIVPDLVVELVSPSNSDADIVDKVVRYLKGGVALVWVAWPHRKSVSVFRPGQAERTFGIGDTLDGEEVLPGFRLSIATIFRKRGRFDL